VPVVPDNGPYPWEEDVPEDASGASLIRAERARQISAEGYTPEHDAAHQDGELARAAACYATPPQHRKADTRFTIRDNRYMLVPQGWPWHPDDWKPASRLRDLVRAGALVTAERDRIAAEIDRLLAQADRKEVRLTGNPGKRLSTADPLTEHDVAERLDNAAMRVVRIMLDARQTGLAGPVKRSRYLTNSLSMLAAELEAWNAVPQQGWSDDGY
jgi:hypothetical protein